jgi:retinol dehydrogenase 12
MAVPSGSKSANGHELHMATNCLGPFLFTKLLTPLMQKTAADSPPGQVRVSWAGSLGIDVGSPNAGGIDFDSDGTPVPCKAAQETYGTSKVGNLYLASQYAYHYPLDDDSGVGVVSNAFNPGNLYTELGRTFPKIVQRILAATLLYPAVYGAYTEVYAGWSEEMGRPERHGGYVKPWGRPSDVRVEVQREVDSGMRGEEMSKAVKFWDWCERESKDYC